MDVHIENPLKIYNSLSKQKEIFTPLNEGSVGMYVCGPTVYSNVHLGNVRTFVSFDTVFRYLKFLGYKVRYVRNITDVGHLENDADTGEGSAQSNCFLPFFCAYRKCFWQTAKRCFFDWDSIWHQIGSSLIFSIGTFYADCEHEILPTFFL